MRCLKLSREKASSIIIVGIVLISFKNTAITNYTSLNYGLKLKASFLIDYIMDSYTAVAYT